MTEQKFIINNTIVYVLKTTNTKSLLVKVNDTIN
jgi:hypothetical protein